METEAEIEVGLVFVLAKVVVREVGATAVVMLLTGIVMRPVVEPEREMENEGR
jgi:hypothetical protein